MCSREKKTAHVASPPEDTKHAGTSARVYTAQLTVRSAANMPVDAIRSPTAMVGWVRSFAAAGGGCEAKSAQSAGMMYAEERARKARIC